MDEFIGVVILGMLAIVIFLFGMSCGNIDGKNAVYNEAIQVGVAEYILLSNTNSKTEFRWKTNLITK